MSSNNFCHPPTEEIGTEEIGTELMGIPAMATLLIGTDEIGTELIGEDDSPTLLIGELAVFFWSFATASAGMSTNLISLPEARTTAGSAVSSA